MLCSDPVEHVIVDVQTGDGYTCTLDSAGRVECHGGFVPKLCARSLPAVSEPD